MKILLLGGTQFVGRHIAEALVKAGHQVTLFNRGQTADSLSANLERLRGDRDLGLPGLAQLAGRTWDVCVDVSGYTPSQVRASAQMLRDSVGHYVFMSAVSVYGAPAAGPVDESFPQLPPAAESVTGIDRDTYGPLKVTCERIVEEYYPDRSTLLRPQIVAGPHDPYDRFSYWVRRVTQGTEMLAPGDGSDFLQVIDARDVARFVAGVSEHRLTGSFNLSGHRVTWAAFLEILGAKCLVWVPAHLLSDQSVPESELPLYRPVGGPRSRLMHVSHDRAVAAGLTLTPVETTARDVRAWLPTSTLAPALSGEREAELIRLSRLPTP